MRNAISSCGATFGRALALALFSSSAAAHVLYVDRAAPAGGSGLSWSNAYKEVQSALDHADIDLSVTEIWVAQGIYNPGGTAATRSSYFRLRYGISLFGGFPPGSHASSPGMSDRDPEEHATRLSGDIGVAGDPTDNCYTVVYVPNGSTATLDGFRVTGGYADDFSGSITWRGGGLYAAECELVVRNCRFVGNRAFEGGGMFLYGAEVLIEDCDLRHNEALDGPGGAIRAESSQERSATVCVRRSRFIDNLASEDGGAVAAAGGGALIVELGLANCELLGNEAGWSGGAIAMEVGEADLIHLSFHANGAGLEGGALAASGASLLLANSVLWDDFAPADPELSVPLGTSVVSHCCIDGLAGTGIAGTGNFDAEPHFLDAAGSDGVSGTGDDDLRLHCYSPLKDAGSMAHVDVPPCFTALVDDLEGYLRTPPHDVGAREHLESGVRTCVGDGSGTACPCGNESAAGEMAGCGNSTSAGGVLCSAALPRILPDELRLDVMSLPASQPTILVAGTTAIGGGAGLPFYDGLRCAGGGVVRVAVRPSTVDGHASFGPGIATRLGASSGSSYVFQAWYRDPSGPCATGANLTNGYLIVFGS